MDEDDLSRSSFSKKPLQPLFQMDRLVGQRYFYSDKKNSFIERGNSDIFTSYIIENINISRFFSRSQKTPLLPLNDIHTHNYFPHLDMDVKLPWYQHLLPLEPLNSKTWDTSAASLFQEVAFALSSSRGKDSKTEDRQWKNIHLSGLEEPGNLDCKHVTGFHVLFTVSSESEGLTLVLWDLVTQDITQSCVGKNSFFVEYTREEPLWLVLSGEQL